jgi:hypothetical protein
MGFYLLLLLFEDGLSSSSYIAYFIDNSILFFDFLPVFLIELLVKILLGAVMLKLSISSS